ncbi:MAG TPA: hypothetical protein VF070_00855 [Streptosporangiaceae bacterium]
MGRRYRLAWESERARLRDEQALAELGANLLLRRVPAGLDARARRVLLEGGGAIGYDAPVIAVPARRRPCRRWAGKFRPAHRQLRGVRRPLRGRTGHLRRRDVACWHNPSSVRGCGWSTG